MRQTKVLINEILISSIHNGRNNPISNIHHLKYNPRERAKQLMNSNLVYSISFSFVRTANDVAQRAKRKWETNTN